MPELDLKTINWSLIALIISTIAAAVSAIYAYKNIDAVTFRNRPYFYLDVNLLEQENVNQEIKLKNISQINKKQNGDKPIYLQFDFKNIGNDPAKEFLSKILILDKNDLEKNNYNVEYLKILESSSLIFNNSETFEKNFSNYAYYYDPVSFQTRYFLCEIRYINPLTNKEYVQYIIKKWITNENKLSIKDISKKEKPNIKNYLKTIQELSTKKVKEEGFEKDKGKWKTKEL
ncbi:MAG: hypothetical protein A2Y25_03895 [Candidatus Melainabacteria bacterium GWF2_37_15]|nr:MAG: hypothetical protein A2Y25_03895 [Candidatus Melainabacteria bacterium GWF2_37_15]